jgi:dihydrofolate reductase
MRNIVLFNLITLDGFFEGLKQEIDWHHVDEEFHLFAKNQLQYADTLLFGRITYDLMAGTITGPSPDQRFSYLR